MRASTAGTPGLVTVAMSTYNASSTIVETLESVLAQSWPAVEVVVIDDGSRDDTYDKLLSFGERIRSVRQPNKGIPACRNATFAMARGEYIAILDHDDICEPDRLAIQVGILRRFPEVVLCATDFSAFGPGGTLSPSYGATYYSSIPAGGLDAIFPDRQRVELAAGTWPSLREPRRVDVGIGSAYPDIAFGNFVHPPTVMFRRSALDCSGGPDNNLNNASDWEFFVRLSRCGPFAHVHEPLLRYRLSETQISSIEVHGGRGNVDTVNAAEKIWAADPALRAAQPGRVRRCRREFCYDAAYGLGSRNRPLALRMLARSVANGGVSLETAKTAARILLPAGITRALETRRT